MVVITRAMLSALLVAVALLVSGHSYARASTSEGCGRVVILLAGYNTSSADVPGTFRDIVGTLSRTAGYAAPPIDFSYRYPARYTAGDTYNALPSQAVQSLRRTIAARFAACSEAQFDLIGHSLGGVVALRYLSLYGSTPQGRHVRHVITLDSPVNGTSHARLVMAAAVLGQTRLVGSPTGLYLAAQGRNSGTRASNIALVRRLAPTTTVTTLASADDWIVPPGDAEIPGAYEEFHSGRNLAACARGIQYAPSCLGHDRVLHDSRVLTEIRSLLAAPESSP